MAWILPSTLWLLLLSSIATASPTSEQFTEELNLHPLRDGRVAAHFTFQTTLQNSLPRSPDTLQVEDSPQHFTLFPLSLGQILRQYAVTELHLTLNAGKWDYSRWGHPPEAGVAPGAELWAWMGQSEGASIDERWKGLRNAFSGLFCASLGSLDEHRTTSPSYTFRPEGTLPRFSKSHQLRHASLPSEHVCTENLTPFLKLLPCKSSSGLASLLNPHKLFDADWHGMGVHVLWDQTIGVTVRLTFQAVLDPVRGSILKKRDWSLRSLFDRTVNRACPAASESSLRVTLPKNEEYTILPAPTFIHDDVATFRTADANMPLNVALSWPQEQSFSYPLVPPDPPLANFTVVRTLTGATQSRGKLTAQIRNNLPRDVQAVYLETMPWLVQFELHTIKLLVDNGNRNTRNDLISHISYTPPEAHGRPTLFEVLLALPANSTVRLTMDVTKQFLRYTEHQPDAQRGWDLPPAVLVPFATTSNSSNINIPFGDASPENIRLPRVYSPAVLVDLATPDFSMPYNVIIMSSTLIALVFGCIFNLMTRRFVFLPIGRPSIATSSTSVSEIAAVAAKEGEEAGRRDVVIGS